MIVWDGMDIVFLIICVIGLGIALVCYVFGMIFGIVHSRRKKRWERVAEYLERKDEENGKRETD